MTDRPNPPLTDADKLLAVLRVVMPGDWKKACGTVAMFYRDKQGIVVASKPLDPTSLDDLRRVLLALSGEQQSRFLRFATVQHQEQGGDYQTCLMDAYEALTAPTTQILDALHRAVCPE